MYVTEKIFRIIELLRSLYVCLFVSVGCFSVFVASYPALCLCVGLCQSSLLVQPIFVYVVVHILRLHHPFGLPSIISHTKI